MKTCILAVESSVDQLGNELARQSNNEGVGDDGDSDRDLVNNTIEVLYLIVYYLPSVSIIPSHTPMFWTFSAIGRLQIIN